MHSNFGFDFHTYNNIEHLTQNGTLLYGVLLGTIIVIILICFYFKKKSIKQSSLSNVSFFCQKCGYKNNFHSDRTQSPKFVFFDKTDPGTSLRSRQWKQAKELSASALACQSRYERKFNVGNLDRRLDLKSNNASKDPLKRQSIKRTAEASNYDPFSFDKRKKIDKRKLLGFKTRPESKTDTAQVRVEKPVGGIGFFKRML
ncbi:uncharacterized protein LOC113470479 [Diaphorina citri]|uniref:Uncharacterized protein LOC113470479 n=1 Tax=Diaphorina citri TaxID=121845 RepID=A0A3Q0JDF6_DIACI|nr:uncharacterized protein LOC113470479 [Diaphorina citri]